MTKCDKVLIISVLILSMAGLTFVSAVSIDNNEKYVVVQVNGEIAKKISVNGTEKNQIYDFEFGNGNKGYIEIDNGQVRMLEMDREICPKSICSDLGWISKKYQSIICLPNKISVGIEQKAEEELDIISY